MNMGVPITAGPGMSGSGSVPVGMTTGVHPGTVGSLSQGGPGSGIGISSSSSLGGAGMGASTGAGVGGMMPPVGLDFAKVSCLILGTYIGFWMEKTAHIFNNFSFPILFFCIISHVYIIQLVDSYRAILEQAQSITGVTYLPPVNGNSNNNTTAGGRPTSASSVHRGAGQSALTQEVMDGMLQNATYGMQMLDVALRAKSLQGPGPPPSSQHYPQHQPQHPSQPPLNSTSSLTAPSTQVQPTSSTTSVNPGPSSSGSSYYNTNSHPHPQQNSSSNSSSPRTMKDGGGGVKSGADDGGRKVKSEGSVDKGVLSNGTSSSSTTTTATAAVSTGATSAGAGSTAPTSGDRSKRQVRYL